MANAPDKPRASRPYLPPPPDDSPEWVAVPRMDPPPASLEALVRHRKTPTRRKRDASFIWVVALLAAIVAVLTYLAVSH